MFKELDYHVFALVDAYSLLGRIVMILQDVSQL